ncbi:MAG: hypothetical protein U5L76_04575 [Patescibacteria group bacterium]|nr:hypothetical protein [Patescibacteria group bacterium]
MRLPMAYTKERVHQVNQRRIIRGIIFLFFGVYLAINYIASNGFDGLTITFPGGLLAILLLVSGIYQIRLAQRKVCPWYLLHQYPALRTPFKSIKKALYELWLDLNEVYKIF